MLSSMRVLSLDTTSRAGSLALFIDDREADVRVGESGRTHGQRLPAEIADMLEAHGLTVRDVDLFAVAAGPGSFTGIRVGIATIQGLALVTGRPVVPVSALEALAYSVRGAAGTRLIGAWIDAQRREVFAALYAASGGRDAAGRDPSTDLVERAAPSVGSAASILAGWQTKAGPAPVVFAGSGAVAYREVIRAARHAGIADVLDEVPPLAPAIAMIAMARAAAGGDLRPHAIVPVYVRRPDAELAREKHRNPHSS